MIMFFKHEKSISKYKKTDDFIIMQKSKSIRLNTLFD